MLKPEQYQTPNAEKGSVYLATINQTLTPEELKEFATELPGRIEQIRKFVESAESMISKGTFQIGSRIIFTSPKAEKGEFYLPLLKRDLEHLKEAQREVESKS